LPVDRHHHARDRTPAVVGAHPAGHPYQPFGSDTPHKQELASGVLARASRIVVDSLAQCRLRGEVHQALKAGVITAERIEEIGDLVLGRRPARTDDDGITVFDSTGLAVQDVQIATAVTQAAVTP
jgi:ornithine cyclodeaminase